MDRKLIWTYLDKLVLGLGYSTAGCARQSMDIATTKEFNVYVEMQKLGLVGVHLSSRKLYAQVTLTEAGLVYWRKLLWQVITRTKHRRACWAKRMRRYTGKHFSYTSFKGDHARFIRQNAHYLNSAQEREALRHLTGQAMIRAVEVYEKNPLFDPLYSRFTDFEEVYLLLDYWTKEAAGSPDRPDAEKFQREALRWVAYYTEELLRTQRSVIRRTHGDFMRTMRNLKASRLPC